MGTTAQKLQAVLNSKSAIKTAIAKYDSSVGDTLSDYAPIVSDMADDIAELNTYKQNLGNFVTNERISELVIPFSQGATLRPYLFYGVMADNIYISSGFTTFSQNQFRALNYGASSSEICYLHLPNTITTMSTSNTWVTAAYVVPILENGWDCNFTLAGLDTRPITREILLTNVINPLKDLRGGTAKTLTFASEAQYNLVKDEADALPSTKNWGITY